MCSIIQIDLALSSILLVSSPFAFADLCMSCPMHAPQIESISPPYHGYLFSLGHVLSSHPHFPDNLFLVQIIKMINPSPVHWIHRASTIQVRRHNMY